MLNKNDLVEIIELAQAGNEIAKNTLVRMMLDNGYMKQLNRYLYRNRLLNPDDIQSEFWIGVVQSIPKVKHDIGDPLQYLTFKGICNVKSIMRTTIRKSVFFICYDCNKRGNIRHHDRVCPYCKSENIKTMQYEINPTEDDNIVEPTRSNFNEINIQDRIERFKNILTERERDVFVLIVEKGYTMDSCNNYLKEIGEILNITPQCVNAYLRKIRIKFEESV